jgi:hypothetical protein
MNDNEQARHDAAKLAFMLSQLRDDLDEMISGLEAGSLDHDVARAGARTQLQWLLDQLKVDPANK